MHVVPSSASSLFKLSGWFEGRRVAVDDVVPPQHAAYAVLAELGGITLRDPAPNLVSLTFRHVCDAAPELALWEAALATRMVGVAEQDGGHGELYLTERGQLVGCSLVHPACWLVGQTFQEGLLDLIEGRRSRPMMLPGQREMTLYGTRFEQGDDEVLGPRDLV